MDLYPPIEPYNSEFIHIDGHSIYFEECGNPNGYPIIYLHGGPGVGCGPNDRRFFDPQKWRVLLIDQRGSGRSKPYGSTENNTTHLLAQDIVTITEKFGIKQAALFGGSWGSTLALYYEINFPQRVSAMILRGIFLGTYEELGFLYGGGNGLFYPKDWERFLANVPVDRRGDILGYFYEKMTNGTVEERRKFAFEMARFEESLLYLEPPPEDQVDDETTDSYYESTGLIETHYFVNNCFMPDGYILDNIAGIHRIPVSIVQGRYDMVCPPVNAYKLRQALEKSGHDVAWNLVTAGHSKSDPATQSKILEETERIYRLLVPHH